MFDKLLQLHPGGPARQAPTGRLQSAVIHHDGGARLGSVPFAGVWSERRRRLVESPHGGTKARETTGLASVALLVSDERTPPVSEALRCHPMTARPGRRAPAREAPMDVADLLYGH